MEIGKSYKCIKDFKSNIDSEILLKKNEYYELIEITQCVIYQDGIANVSEIIKKGFQSQKNEESAMEYKFKVINGKNIKFIDHYWTILDVYFDININDSI